LNALSGGDIEQVTDSEKLLVESPVFVTPGSKQFTLSPSQEILNPPTANKSSKSGRSTFSIARVICLLSLPILW
jgi:hypothetical protein